MVSSHPHIADGLKQTTTCSFFYTINFGGFIWMHLGMWLHPLLDVPINPSGSSSSPVSQSRNQLPPLVIYMHCSAIIQVIKTPADTLFLFTLWVWFISVSVNVKQNQIPSFICAFVVCEYVCFSNWLSVLRFVVGFRFKCSFFLSLYLPHATLCYRLAF